MEPLAEVNGEAITAGDLERAVGAKLRQLELQVYDLKRRQLDNPHGRAALGPGGGERGIPVGALLDAEVTAKVGLVTEQVLSQI